jgi:hypothetical protein
MPLEVWYSICSIEAFPRRTLFRKDQDFLAFERVIEETLRMRADANLCFQHAFESLAHDWLELVN